MSGEPPRGRIIGCSVVPEKERVINASSLKQPTIARMWPGRTSRDRADEYEAYKGSPHETEKIVCLAVALYG